MKLNDKSIYICCSNAKKGGFFSWLQRFVTGYDVTHSEPILHGNLCEKTVGLSADKFCTLESIQDLIDNPDIDVWIYEIPTCSYYEYICNEEWEFALENIGKYYGYLQILYFIPRRLAELIGWDIRRWWNPFPSGRLCSEVCWKYLMRFSFYLFKDKKDFGIELRKWKPDNIHSGDIKYLMDKYFKIIK